MTTKSGIKILDFEIKPEINCGLLRLYFNEWFEGLFTDIIIILDFKAGRVIYTRPEFAALFAHLHPKKRQLYLNSFTSGLTEISFDSRCFMETRLPESEQMRESKSMLDEMLYSFDGEGKARSWTTVGLNGIISKSIEYEYRGKSGNIAGVEDEKWTWTAGNRILFKKEGKLCVLDPQTSQITELCKFPDSIVHFSHGSGKTFVLSMCYAPPGKVCHNITELDSRMLCISSPLLSEPLSGTVVFHKGDYIYPVSGESGNHYIVIQSGETGKIEYLTNPDSKRHVPKSLENSLFYLGEEIKEKEKRLCLYKMDIDERKEKCVLDINQVLEEISENILACSGMAV